MTAAAEAAGWDSTYRERGDDVSWFEVAPTTSLEMIHQLPLSADAAIVDVGGGASTLVDHLLAEGRTDLTVVDLSQVALDRAAARVARTRSDNSAAVEWVRADITAWQPERRFDLWHDRAAFHFLGGEADRQRYLEALRDAVPHGWALIAAFAPDGPEACSGLPVTRYSAEGLAATLEGFEVVSTRRHVHTTPWGATQPFTYVLARRS